MKKKSKWIYTWETCRFSSALAVTVPPIMQIQSQFPYVWYFNCVILLHHQLLTWVNRLHNSGGRSGNIYQHIYAVEIQQLRDSHVTGKVVNGINQYSCWKAVIMLTLRPVQDKRDVKAAEKLVNIKLKFNNVCCVGRTITTFTWHLKKKRKTSNSSFCRRFNPKQFPSKSLTTPNKHQVRILCCV